MAKEIERKFLVNVSLLPRFGPQDVSNIIHQGYLSTDPVVRIRCYHNNEEVYLTIKGDGLLERDEFEYKIPYEDGKQLFKLCKHSLSKIRYYVNVSNHLWEIDCFMGQHSGLWLAEIELEYPDEIFMMPEWLGDEVTYDARYSNAVLAQAGCFPDEGT